MNFKVSVVVPVYNVEKYLHRCVDSLLKQSYKNLEIILINDGSLDSSGEICDELAKKDHRIKVVHQKNGGLSAARNTGLNHVTGDYISFIDSDDWIEQSMYEEMLYYAYNHNLDIIECDIQSTMDPEKKAKEKFIIENKEQNALRIIENQFFSVCRRIYRYNLIKDLRFIENYIYEDMIFTTFFFKRIDKVGYINKPFYNYFIENSSSIMHGAYKEKNVKSIDAIRIFQENIKNCFDSEKINKAASNYITFFALHHYQELFNNTNFDPDYKHRKFLKRLINRNYDSNSANNIHTKIARYSPLFIFSVFNKLNKLRKKI
ncbi:glycosyltransferase [Jejuia pallidilutea]|nr:glycosyltransferase [Jejuia pallidilutea]GAL90631.1 beta-1,3-glucosyltransferase [Jejuia pallidilutea]